MAAPATITVTAAYAGIRITLESVTPEAKRARAVATIAANMNADATAQARLEAKAAMLEDQVGALHVMWEQLEKYGLLVEGEQCLDLSRYVWRNNTPLCMYRMPDDWFAK